MIEIVETEQHDFSEEEPEEYHLELFEHLAKLPSSLRPPTKALLVLATPRCGSTLFTQALNRTFRLGMCEEWLNYDYFRAYCKILDKKFDLQEYLRFVQRKTTRGNGVFCLKWHINQLVSMTQNLSIGIESMDFDHIIYLERRDKIAQAVSLCKTSVGGKYRSYWPGESEPQVSRQGIADCLQHIVKYDRFAYAYLMRYIDSIFRYEDFQTLGWGADGCYNKVLNALGAEPVDHFSAGELKKQGNEHSKAAADDFRCYILGEKK